jgi:hypothetical protein
MYSKSFIIDGYSLEAISRVIDFEMFSVPLERNLLNINKKNNAGAKPYDVILLFKIWIFQRYYGLGDHQVEYQIVDRTSFKAFLSLSTGDKVPDEKTVWSLRERITKTGLVEELFEQFVSYLEKQELIVNEGVLVDASFTVAPRQRNTKQENKQVKEGKGDQLWN